MRSVAARICPAPEASGRERSGGDGNKRKLMAEMRERCKSLINLICVATERNGAHSISLLSLLDPVRAPEFKT